MQLIIEPETVKTLLDFCLELCQLYVRGFAEAGVPVTVFDSFISPPLLSPDLYHDQIMPLHQQLFSFIEHLGKNSRPLIAGGQSIELLPYTVNTGANQFLLDFSVPTQQVKQILKQYPDITFRDNLCPMTIAEQTGQEVAAYVRSILKELSAYNNLILGTGILPPQTPLKNIKIIRQQS